jgi:hypothetical protein
MHCANLDCVVGGVKVADSPVSSSDLSASYSSQRTVPRYIFVAVTEIIESASQACIVAKTSKISSKGCYVDTPDPLPTGTYLDMVISRGEGSFATKGKVIYVHEGVGMGVVFIDPIKDQLNILRSWLAENSPTGTP